MVSTQSTRQNNHSERVAGSRGSSFVRNRTGPFTTALTTVGRGGCNWQSCSFPPYAVTVGAPIIQPTTAPHAKTVLNSITAHQGNSKAVHALNTTQGGSSLSAAATSSSAG